MKRSRSVFVEMILIWIFIIILVVNALFTGCERRDTTVANRFADDTDFVLLIAIDADYVEQNARPYDFCIMALSTYFDEREGANSQVLISQLGSDRPVIWQGKPEDFKRDFPSPSAFQEYLKNEKTPTTKNVTEGIAFSLDYLTRHPSVRSKKPSVALIISEMIDSSPTVESETEAINAIIRYAKTGGALGFFFVDSHRMKYVEDELLKRAGMTMYTLQGDVHGRPPLPSFE